MQERPGQIGDYWLSKRRGSEQWCRTWYDTATRQTRRESLGTADFQEGKLRLWEWFAKHGRASTPKGEAWNMMGAILAAQPDGGDEWMKKHLPGPVTLVWRWVGAPKYARYRAALDGRAPGV